MKSRLWLKRFAKPSAKLQKLPPLTGRTAKSGKACQMYPPWDVNRAFKLERFSAKIAILNCPVKNWLNAMPLLKPYLSQPLMRLCL